MISHQLSQSSCSLFGFCEAAMQLDSNVSEMELRYDILLQLRVQVSYPCALLSLSSSFFPFGASCRFVLLIGLFDSGLLVCIFIVYPILVFSNSWILECSRVIGDEAATLTALL